MFLNPEQQKRLLPLSKAVAKAFDNAMWLELGAMTGCIDLVQGHHRLLRSLSWGDPDYAGNVLDVLVSIVQRDPKNLAVIESYVAENVEGAGGESLSSAPGQRKLYITPHAFTVPEDKPDPTLVSVMMPFDAGFAKVHEAIKQACSDAGLRSNRVDNMWEHSTVIPDVFSLICRSSIVICDFSGRNPNVFYECGIAHTLGKHVIPITQQPDDVPFDLQHHRYLHYLKNAEGLQHLRTELAARLRTLTDDEVPAFSMSS
jgi:hypothetical protein